MEELIKKIEKLNWVVDYEEEYLTMSKFSPAGEDFSFTIKHENSVEIAIEEIKEYADDFDEEEHIKMWIEGQNTVSGVPSIKELVKDAEDIYDMLQELAEDI